MSINILYVEDNPVNTRLVRKMLQLTAYHLLEAETAAAAYTLALEEHPKLILLDVGLPDEDGITLARRIHRTPELAAIPLVGLTADNRDETTHGLIAAGCVEVLHKPISRFALLNMIRQRAPLPTIPAASVTETAPASADTARKRVLIVEDHSDLRTIFAAAFDRRYFQVESASDGREAIEMLQTGLPDVVVLDINLPEVSGFDVLRYIRTHQHDQQVKVILVTGNAIASLDPQVDDADLMLVKPVNVPDLITLAQRLIATG